MYFCYPKRPYTAAQKLLHPSFLKDFGVVKFLKKNIKTIVNEIFF